MVMQIEARLLGVGKGTLVAAKLIGPRDLERSAKKFAPEMTAIVAGELYLMRDNVTFGLFNWMMTGYKIVGDRAAKLKALLADPANAEKSITCISLLDKQAFAKRASELTGRIFKVADDARSCDNPGKRLPEKAFRLLEVIPT
jgi:hypothetical protein